MKRFTQCKSRLATKVFSHYAYGDPLPIYARFVGEDDLSVAENDPGAITIYIRCEREDGHSGKHLARGTSGWMDADAANGGEEGMS